MTNLNGESADAEVPASKASTQAMARYTLMTAAPAFVVTVGMDMESMASVRAGEE